jgi:phospholipid/cholesterol/gamma-HCH transport system substrate-binding protein
MAEKEYNLTEVLVGGVVLAVAVGFFAYAAQSTGMSGGSDSYELTASFRSAEGISVGTDVRMAGVQVGSVTDMSLHPETFQAVTTFTVQGDLEIPDDSALAVSSESLLGGAFLEILPGGSPFMLQAGDPIVDTQGSVSLITLLLRIFGGNNSE